MSQIVIFVMLLLANFASCDVSDKECRKFTENTTGGAHIAWSTPAPVKLSTSPSIFREKEKRKFVQKSLLIVFDGSPSMKDDLEQMRDAAKQIIKKYSDREESPIKNYVLTIFQDPSKRE